MPTSHLKQAALDSWDNIYFGLPSLSQESMVLSQLLILSWAFLSLTKLELQPSWISDSLLWYTKKWKNNNSEIDKSLKNNTYIYWVSHLLGKIQNPRFLWPLQSHSKFEVLLAKIFSLKQKKSNTSSYYRKIQISFFQENSLWFL